MSALWNRLRSLIAGQGAGNRDRSDNRTPPAPALSDNGTIHLVEVPATVSAASLRQAIRQFNSGRVALLFQPAPQESWLDPAREEQLGQAARESGLVQFQVLRRQAEAQGIGVAVITRNERLRLQAEDAGLPVFGTVEGAQEHGWHWGRSRLAYRPPSPPRNQEEPVSERRRGTLTARFRRVRVSQGSRQGVGPITEMIVLAGVLVLSLLAVSALVAFVVPVASVTLVPAQEPIAARAAVSARSDLEEADLTQNLVPARRIGQRVEGDGTTAATGSRLAPDEPAGGVVVFTNRRPDSLEIPAGTLVATSTGANVRFETLEPALLPGGIGQQITVPVQAVEPGVSGNVRAFSINTVEGSLALSVNVINPESMSGGTAKDVAVVTQEDKDRLRNELLQHVTQDAYQALGELLEEGEFVPPETVGTLIVAETYDRFTDEEADEVSLRLRLLATALAVDGSSAEEIALRALGERIPRRGRLLADSVSFSRSGATILEDGDVTEIAFGMTASGVAVLDIDPAAVRAAIRGLTPEEAVAQLQDAWRLQSPPELQLGPEWLLPILSRLDFPWLPVRVADRVPWLPFRTQVRVEFAG